MQLGYLILNKSATNTQTTIEIYLLTFCSEQVDPKVTLHHVKSFLIMETLIRNQDGSHNNAGLDKIKHFNVRCTVIVHKFIYVMPRSG